MAPQSNTTAKIMPARTAKSRINHNKLLTSTIKGPIQAKTKVQKPSSSKSKPSKTPNPKIKVTKSTAKKTGAFRPKNKNATRNTAQAQATTQAPPPLQASTVDAPGGRTRAQRILRKIAIDDKDISYDALAKAEKGDL